MFTSDGLGIVPRAEGTANHGAASGCAAGGAGDDVKTVGTTSSSSEDIAVYCALNLLEDISQPVILVPSQWLG